MRLRILACALVIGALMVPMCPVPAWSSDSSNHTAAILSDLVTPLVIAGELSLMAGGRRGKLEATQGAKALAATAFATELLKLTVREKRPEGNSRDSFPSGHTSEAFAMATVWSAYHPKQAWLAYTTAAAIGWSRVEQNKHTWKDVVAGALLGHFIAKHFTNEHLYAGPGGLGVQYRF